MRCARPIVTRDEAWRRLHRTPAALTWLCWRLRSLSGAKPAASTVSSLEVIQLPSFLLHSGPAGSDAVIVDAFEGHVMRLELAGIEWDEESLSPCVTSLSIEQARHAASRLRLAAPWIARPATSSRDSAPDAEIVGYPYWAYYYERTPGRLDVKLLDAITAKLAGPRIKTALLSALARQSGRKPLDRADNNTR